MITAQHTLFTASFGSKKCVDLSLPPFSTYFNRICHQSDYSFSQKLGNKLRNNDVECILFPSARDVENGSNVALFMPRTLKGRKPRSMVEWASQVSSKAVQFKCIRYGGSYQFEIGQFIDKSGNLPILA